MMGPTNPFSRELHASKYRADGESFDDYSVRYCRSTSDDDKHFRALIEAIRQQRLLPAGRQQIAVGRPFRTTSFNCFRGDTEIMTANGFQPLYLLAGKEVEVLSPVSGLLERATAKAYGTQFVDRVLVSRTWRGNRDPVEIFATRNHRWILQDGSETQSLAVGDILKAGDGRVPIDAAGFAHGFVFGDGSKIERDNDRFAVRLCGAKAQYADRISEGANIVSRTRPPSYPDGDVLLRIASAVDLKDLPPPCATLGYVRGFVEGWIAADGCTKDYIAHDGGRYAHQVHSINRDAIMWLRDHLVLAGYAPVGVITEDNKPTNYGKRSAPLCRMMFRPVAEHAGFRVVRIDPDVSRETVYCVEEPKHRQIVLRNGLRSGQCFVMGTIPDSTDGIFDCLKESALTLRAGGGIGMDFSTLRPKGDPIRGLGAGAYATGPVSFMTCWHSMSGTIMSAGHRRGAMMGILRCDHPDVELFVRAKRDQATLSNFNISVAVTDAFMEAVYADGLFDLVFDGRRYRQVRARDLWAVIMENNWDWAEPGVVFIDTINRMNPLGYCETIVATNPCSEQCLPPYGACLLGSLNVVKYIVPKRIHSVDEPKYELDLDLMAHDAALAVRAFDNVIDRSAYPLPQQEQEAKSKRRMGLGITGMANAAEICGHAYASPGYLELQDLVLSTIQRAAIEASVENAKRKGSFDAFCADKWLASGFGTTLPDDLRDLIRRHGLRNGQLLSIAPTGTISMCADNVSSGIEPPFALKVRRLVHMPGGQKEIDVDDFALTNYGVAGKTSHDVSPEEHIAVLCGAQKWIDSAISKTCNVWGARTGEQKRPGEIDFHEFKDLYVMAHKGGAKGCSIYNANGERSGILAARDDEPADEQACTIDEHGRRECA